jgi:hypothetical protein
VSLEVRSVAWLIDLIIQFGCPGPFFHLGLEFFLKDLLALVYFKGDSVVEASTCEPFQLLVLHAMSGVLQNTSGHSSPDGSDVNVDVADKNGTHVVFNEQTNYVPKRIIITVSPYQIKFFYGYVRKSG